MNAPALVCRVEFANREGRVRASGLTSYTRDITPTGDRSWIVPLERLHNVAKELVDDGFEIRTHVKVG